MSIFKAHPSIDALRSDLLQPLQGALQELANIVGLTDVLTENERVRGEDPDAGCDYTLMKKIRLNNLSPHDKEAMAKCAVNVEMADPLSGKRTRVYLRDDPRTPEEHAMKRRKLNNALVEKRKQLLQEVKDAAIAVVHESVRGLTLKNPNPTMTFRTPTPQCHPYRPGTDPGVEHVARLIRGFRPDTPFAGKPE